MLVLKIDLVKHMHGAAHRQNIMLIALCGGSGTYRDDSTCFMTQAYFGMRSNSTASELVMEVQADRNSNEPCNANN